MRRLKPVVVGGLLALSGIFGATVATSSATNRHTRTGMVTGSVAFVDRGASGVVRVVSASGRVVAHDDVRWDHGHFRFVLTAGRYEFVLKVNPPHFVWAGCPSKQPARVQATRTTHVYLSQGCENTY